MAKTPPQPSIQVPRPPLPVQLTWGPVPTRGSSALHAPARPLWQEPAQPLQESFIPFSGKQTNSPLHLFHKSPDLIRFSSFLPVLGQSLLGAEGNSFAPAVRKRLSPVRKIIKPSSHIRGNESPFLTQFAGRLFPLHWRRRCRLNLSSCQMDPPPLAPPLPSPLSPETLLSP